MSGNCLNDTREGAYKFMNSKLVFFSILFVLMGFFFLPLSYGQEIKQGEVMTLPRLIEIGLKHNPTSRAAESTIRAFGSIVGQAQSAYYPRLDLIGDYSDSSSEIKGSGRIVNSVFAAGPAVTWNIYDFGRTASQVRIAKLDLESVRSDYDTTANAITLNVKTAYYGVLQAKRNRDVATQVVNQFQEHLRQAQGFYEVGAKPKIDVTRAQVDLSNARLNLIKAENALQIAWTTLNNAIGLPEAPPYDIEDNLAFQPYAITFEEALKRAYENRPDLKAQAFLQRAAGESVSFARAGFFPILTGRGSFTWTGDSLPLQENWTLGVAINIPIFNGFLTKKQVEEAKANTNTAQAQVENLRQRIYLENRQAYLNLKEAESSLPTAELGVTEAQENLDLANGRYAAGVGSPLEVTDALVSFSDAQTAYITVLYNYKVAQANLENAMGAR
jgi:outer membrane protein